MSDFQVIAAFDFDKTLTDRDSFLRFLHFAAGSWACSLQFFQLAPVAIAYFLGLCPRERVKQAAIRHFFSGWSVKRFQWLSKRYGREILPRFVLSSAMDRFHQHKSAGHRCIIVSASLEHYLKPWATSVGFDDVLATRLEVEEGRLTGHLLGSNCYGAEKVRRLEALLGARENYELFAYGDSRGDKELLDYADKGFYRQIGAYRREGMPW